jgi:hypothetical protein
MILSNILISDVLSYSSVGWYDDKSVLIRLLIQAGRHHKFLPIIMLIR